MITVTLPKEEYDALVARATLVTSEIEDKSLRWARSLEMSLRSCKRPKMSPSELADFISARTRQLQDHSKQ